MLEDADNTLVCLILWYMSDAEDIHGRVRFVPLALPSSTRVTAGRTDS